MLYSAGIYQVENNLKFTFPSDYKMYYREQQEIQRAAAQYANLSHEDFDGSIDIHYQNGFIAGVQWHKSKETKKLHWAIRLRKRLLINGNWKWNAWVRDLTARLEIMFTK